MITGLSKWLERKSVKEDKTIHTTQIDRRERKRKTLLYDCLWFSWSVFVLISKVYWCRRIRVETDAADAGCYQICRRLGKLSSGCEVRSHRSLRKMNKMNKITLVITLVKKLWISTGQAHRISFEGGTRAQLSFTLCLCVLEAVLNMENRKKRALLPFGCR